jgi:O-antigen ligase
MRSARFASFLIYALIVLSMWTPSAKSALGPAAELLRYGLFLTVSAFIIGHTYLTRGLTVPLSAEWLLLIAFLLYTSLSVLWSDGSINALIKSVLVLSAMLVAMSIAHAKTLDEILSIHYRCLCGFVVLSFLAVMLFPDVGIETGWELEGDWRGIAGQKNGLGYMAALAFVASVALPIAGGRPTRPLSRPVLARLSMILVCGLCVVNSGSRGALLIGAVGLGSILLARAPGVLQRVALLVFVALAVPLVNLTLPTIELTADQIGVLGATIDTSNRTTLWSFGLEQLAEREYLGFGVSGFWTPERKMIFSDTYGWVLDNFHNGYITILIEGGLIGFFLLTMAVASTMLLYLVAIGNLKDPFLTLGFAYTNMFLFGNLVENEIGRSTTTSFIMFLTMAFALRPHLARLVPRGGLAPGPLVARSSPS